MIVTLLTDFGRAEYYVAALKGVILSVDPRIQVVDLSHEIPPYDIEAAAFLLACVYREFPPGTVQLAVVDPGVGSDRRAVAISAAGQYFVGPDNGIFGPVLAREGDAIVRRITHPALRRRSLSTTFHGRDLFAPAGAALAAGFDFDAVGELVSDPIVLPGAAVEVVANGLAGRIVHIDRFGSCVTNFEQARIEAVGNEFRIRVGEHELGRVHTHYEAVQGLEPFLIWGSAGLLEISANRASAAALLGLSRGDPLRLEFLPEAPPRHRS